jgi:hypothetical protein
MKREVSAAEAVLTFVFFAAWYAGLGLVHPTFPASILGCASLFSSNHCWCSRTSSDTRPPPSM